MALFHKHLIIRAEIDNCPAPEELHFMAKWFKDLVEDIGMKILRGPDVLYHDMEGNEGFTGTCIIETSHIAMHVWDNGSPDSGGIMQLDVYTCGPLDPYDVVANLDFFQPTKISMKYLDRENDLTEIPIQPRDQ